MSGADFVEMFVGVGAARVRDLFKQAREKAPCIVFIDELDAIGKSRAAGAMGGNDEREQTLNQLLVEMDGFDATSGLIILAATNRPDVLDPALLRPGRFDRQVLVDRPDLVGREAILRIHAKAVKLDGRWTSSQGGARDRRASSAPTSPTSSTRRPSSPCARPQEGAAQADFDAAIEKIVAGLEKKSRVMNPKERRDRSPTTRRATPCRRPSPRAPTPCRRSRSCRAASAPSATPSSCPIEDRFILTEDELLGQIDVLLGGRAAEEIVLRQISTGAANDLTRATDIARRMITDYGMSERFRNVALTQRGAMLGAQPESPGPRVRGNHPAVRGRGDRPHDERALRQRAREAAMIAKKLLEVETLDEKAFQKMLDLVHVTPMETAAVTATGGGRCSGT